MVSWLKNLRVMYHQRRIQDLSHVIRVLRDMKHVDNIKHIHDEDILFFTGKMMAHLEKIRDIRGTKI